MIFVRQRESELGVEPRSAGFAAISCEFRALSYCGTAELSLQGLEHFLTQPVSHFSNLDRFLGEL
jgi:hypothetical protein